MVRSSLGWWSERSQRIDQKSRHRPKWGQHPRHPADLSVHREQMHPRWFTCCCCCCCREVSSVVSDSVQPHSRHPTRLPCPWDSPGKNTGVGCHFLLQCMKVKSESEAAQSCLTPSDPMDWQPTRLLHPWDFPGKSTGVGCHCLL